MAMICPTCRNQFNGKMPGRYYSSNWDWVPCQTCMGKGHVDVPQRRYWLKLGGTASVWRASYSRIDRLPFPFPTPTWHVEISEQTYRDLRRHVFPNEPETFDAPDFTPPELDDDDYFFTSMLRWPGHWAHDNSIFCWISTLI